jgi:tetratricopeptide (TPR) repeat protein
MKLFLSCVSSEFKSYRLKLANHLAAARGESFTVKVQEDFQQGGFTLLEYLADFIRGCDLVIHLVGDACGARPEPEHVRALLRSLGQTPSDPLPTWSYTQWEYHLARRFGKRTLVYVAKPDAPRDRGLPVQQSDDDARLQQAHRDHIFRSGEHYKEMASPTNVVREIFFDLGLNPESVKVNNLPFKTLGSLFKGREGFLQQIREALGRVDHRGHQRFAAITASATAATVHGLGGIGKTRAAIEYAHRHADDFTALLFVRADSAASLEQNLASLCGSLVLDLPEKEARETEVQVAAVLRWLQQHPGWFLIFDNVDTDEAAQAVENLLSQLSSAGQVLVTSRLSGWSGAVESLALDVLAEADAVAFLLEQTEERRRKQADDQDQAHRLAVELGQLALAVEQAGAYIVKHRLTFAQYLDLWQSKHDDVLTWFDERIMQYPLSVAVTWRTSFDQLTGAGRELLNLLSWFASDPIPESLLVAGGGPWGDVASDHAVSSADPNDALADLEAYSLVTRAAESPTFSVHRLVADVTRRNLRDDMEYSALRRALRWLHGIFVGRAGVRGKSAILRRALRWLNGAFVGDPQDVRTWPTLDPLGPHVNAAATHADHAGIAEPTARLMADLGLLLDCKARYVEAEPLMQRALAIDQHSYGTEHPRVAINLNNLALLLQATNRLVEAEPLMRRALAIDEHSYGTEHPNVARDLNNLAQLLQARNRLTEAEPLIRRALAIDEQSYGTAYPRVATDLNNLAQLLKATNRLAEAEPLMRRALAIDEHSYGTEQPEVARDLNNLAALLQATNRLAEAEPLMRRALAIEEQS